MAVSDHGAAPAALGYLFQVQWPLLELLRGSRDRPDGAISIELYDDVAWDSDGTPTELLQLKHRVLSARSLGDKDSDLWRTIRVWMDAHPPGDPNGPLLTLVTTQVAAPGSAAAALRPETLDQQLSIDLLNLAARESTDLSTRGTRERYARLSPAERAIFVRRMRVLDAAPPINDIDREVRQQLRYALPRGHEDVFMQRLWAWWYRRALDMLQGQRIRVTGLEVSTVVNDLRDQFTRDTLPTLIDLDELAPDSAAQYRNRPFIHQMRWVNTPNAILEKAIVDYYRAYTQTARWVEEDLIGLDELDAFEKRLRDEWERAFAWMVSDLPAEADDAAKQEAGRQLLRAILDRTDARVRPRYDEPFFARGKHHELADEGLVGWHPNFRQLLEELLLDRSA